MLSGKSIEKTFGMGTIKEMMPNTIKSGYKICSFEDSEMSLYYPRIGDGIPLFALDEVDMTKNGNILEIRQVKDVIRNDNDKILEVI